MNPSIDTSDSLATNLAVCYSGGLLTEPGDRSIHVCAIQGDGSQTVCFFEALKIHYV